MNISRAITKDVHVSTIRGGDTIIYDGVLKTVSFNDIKYSSFMGTSIFGDCFKMGHIKVTKVIKWAMNK